jgi:hypothetical protein
MKTIGTIDFYLFSKLKGNSTSAYARRRVHETVKRLATVQRVRVRGERRRRHSRQFFGRVDGAVFVEGGALMFGACRVLPGICRDSRNAVRDVEVQEPSSWRCAEVEFRELLIKIEIDCSE